MKKVNEFAEQLKAAGVTVNGISGSGPTCVIDFAFGTTPGQRQAANAARATFDWQEKIALTPEAVYQWLIALDEPQRTKILCRIAARCILQFDLREAYGDFADPVPTPPAAAAGGAT